MSANKTEELGGERVNEAAVIRFAQKLAVNEPKYRGQAVKKLRRWLQNRCTQSKTEFTEDDMMNIWKGLHYCMWMADKLLYQESLAEDLASLIDCFSEPEMAFRFVSAFLRTEVREWRGIDRLRLDKFMMLIRRMLRKTLMLIRDSDWSDWHLNRFSAMLSASILNGSNDEVPDGVRIHFIYIFIDELELVSRKMLKAEHLTKLLEPFCSLVAQTTSKAIVADVRKYIFNRLLNDRLGNPSDNLNGMEHDDELEDSEIEDSDIEENGSDGSDDNEMELNGDDSSGDEEDEGQAHFEVDIGGIAEYLSTLASAKTTRNHKTVYSLISQLQNSTERKQSQKKSAPSTVESSDVEDLSALERQSTNQLINAHNKNSKKKDRKRKSKQVESSDEDSSVEDNEDSDNIVEELVTIPTKPSKQPRKKNRVINKQKKMKR